QALIGVQRQESSQHLQRTGEDKGLHQPLTRLASRDRPPGDQDHSNEEPGQAQRPRISKLATDPQTRQTHYQGERGNEGEGEDEETEHGCELNQSITLIGLIRVTGLIEFNPGYDGLPHVTELTQSTQLTPSPPTAIPAGRLSPPLAGSACCGQRCSGLWSR